MSESDNQIATAADFRKLALARADEKFEAPERVVLPGSGLAVMLRRPKPLYFALAGLPLPQTVAARASESATPVISETRETAEKIVNLFSRAFVSPRLSLDPGEGEISPNWLHSDDVTFLFKYLVSEVLAGGQDLATFRAEQEPDAASGAAGEAVALPSL